MAKRKPPAAAEFIEVEILNWEKYNPRRDLKATTWVRLQNSLFEDSNFFGFSHGELLVWIYVLCQASRRQSGAVRVNLAHAEQVGRLPAEIVHSAIQKLEELQCVRVHVTPTSRARHADVTSTSHYERTNVTNERNEHPDPAASRPASGELEAVYQEYPRKEGKADGLRVLRRTLKTTEDLAAFRQAVKNYRDHCQRTGVEAKFIKHFSTFVGPAEHPRWREWLETGAGGSAIDEAAEAKRRDAEAYEAELKRYREQMRGGA